MMNLKIRNIMIVTLSLVLGIFLGAYLGLIFGGTFLGGFDIYEAIGIEGYQISAYFGAFLGPLITVPLSLKFLSKKKEK